MGTHIHHGLMAQVFYKQVTNVIDKTHKESLQWQENMNVFILHSGYFSGGGGKIFVVFVVEKQTTKYLPTIELP